MYLFVYLLCVCVSKALINNSIELRSPLFFFVFVPNSPSFAMCLLIHCGIQLLLLSCVSIRTHLLGSRLMFHTLPMCTWRVKKGRKWNTGKPSERHIQINSDTAKQITYRYNSNYRKSVRHLFACVLDTLKCMSGNPIVGSLFQHSWMWDTTIWHYHTYTSYGIDFLLSQVFSSYICTLICLCVCGEFSFIVNAHENMHISTNWNPFPSIWLSIKLLNSGQKKRTVLSSSSFLLLLVRNANKYPYTLLCIEHFGGENFIPLCSTCIQLYITEHSTFVCCIRLSILLYSQFPIGFRFIVFTI